jgi:ABC-type dipeptide/oligopeptide/nickel transport system permease subunit
MVPEKNKPVLEEPKLDSQDFKFVQLDKSIFDVKFQSKPTTFLKDAVRRFIGNKSSVVAGILIGILILMAIIVPIVDTSDIDHPYLAGKFLPPRWRGFENAGFFDGTIDYDGVIVDYITDPEDPRPANFEPIGVVSELDTFEDYVNNPNIYAIGGALTLRADKRDINAEIYSPAVNINTLNTYQAEIGFNPYNEEIPVTPVYAVYVDVMYETEYVELLVKDFSSDFGTVIINNISTVIEDNKPGTVPAFVTAFSIQFRIELETIAEGDYPAVFIDSFVASNVNNENDDTFENLNFVEGNEVLLRDKDDDLKQYSWKIAGSGSKTLYNAVVVKANFTYNPYLVVFGDREQVVGATELQRFIDAGQISYDFAVGVSSFQLLDDASPIRGVISQRILVGPGGMTAREVVAVVSQYRYLGLPEIPYYVFGTNHLGYDHFKVLMSGLRTSLILGFFVALINVFNGMIWGSISGYFGGTVDLVMERFTEILGGVPWIIVMTLTILHLGNNLGVFLLALCLTGWIGTASVTRSQFYRYKRREYVLASRTMGANDMRLIFRHILPNSIGPLVTGAVLIIPGVIFSEATISYLGLGLQGLPSFGVALSEAQEYIANSPYLIMSGAIVISILMISFNLFGNGLRDAFNPSLKGVQE